LLTLGRKRRKHGMLCNGRYAAVRRTTICLEQWNIQKELGSKRRMVKSEENYTKVNRRRKGTRSNSSG